MFRYIYIASLCLVVAIPALAQMPMSVIASPPFVPPSVYPDGVPSSDYRANSHSVPIIQLIGTRLLVSSAMASETYQPSESVRRTNLATFVDKTRATDPAGAAKMAELFASTDIIGMIDQRMQSTYGMRANSVADAYAVWWVSAWMGTKGRNEDATQEQMAMVKRQASNAFATTPEFALATDAGKQELAEALLIQAALIQGAVDEYKADSSMLAKASASIELGAKTMGLDLATMTLTDKGFRRVRRTGAASERVD
jgi:hypothetical protein